MVLPGGLFSGDIPLEQEASWYREMPWPMEIEKEYGDDGEACRDLLLEREMAARFKKEYTLSPDIKASIRKTSHFYRYVRFTIETIQSRLDPVKGELEAFYESVKEKYAHPELAVVQQVFIEFGPNPDEKKREEVEQKARQVYEKARGGEDFSSLVEQYSSVKKRKGIVGPFPRGRYNPLITEKAFSLKPGEISEPFSTKYGYFVVKGIRKIPPGYPPLEMVKSRLLPDFYREKKERIRRHYALMAMDQFNATVHRDRYTSSNYSSCIDRVVIKGKDFEYTKRDLRELFPDFKPSGDEKSRSDFEVIFQMLLIDRLFLDSPDARTSRTLSQLGFIESYYLGEAFLNRKMEEKVFTEKEIRDYHESRRDEFLTPVERELRMIRVDLKVPRGASPADRHYAELRARERADEALARLKKGEEFSRVAREMSDHPSAKKGGYLGWVREPYSAVIDVVASRLEPGGISGIEKYKNSWVILELLSVKERTPLPFEKVRGRVESLLRGEYRKKLREEIAKWVCDPCNRM